MMARNAMTQYMIVSDIHGNYEALEAVLEDAGDSYDRILCLGDLVGYGADPNAIVEWTRENVAVVIRGNHDRASAAEDPTGVDTIETFNCVEAGRIFSRARPVVIATDDDGYILTSPVDDRIRIRAITHQIAQTQNAVVAPAGVVDDRLQCFQICVNVAQDQERHRRTSETSGGAPNRAGRAMVPMPRETKMEAGPRL